MSDIPQDNTLELLSARTVTAKQKEAALKETLIRQQECLSTAVAALKSKAVTEAAVTPAPAQTPAVGAWTVGDAVHMQCTPQHHPLRPQSVCVCIYVCIYVCMYVCIMYVCMYVCM